MSKRNANAWQPRKKPNFFMRLMSLATSLRKERLLRAHLERVRKSQPERTVRPVFE